MATTSKRLLSLDFFRGLTIAGMILVNDPGSWKTVYSPLLHADWHGCTPTDLVFPFFLFIVGVSIVFSFSKQQQAGKSNGQILLRAAKRALILFLLGLFLAGFPFFGGQDISGTQRGAYIVFLIAFLTTLLGKEVVKQPRSGWTFSDRVKQIWQYLPWVFLLGILVLGFSQFDLSQLRIPGVLQRIALVFFFCAAIFLYFGWKAQLYILGICLLGYWALMTLVPVPGVGAPNLEPETNLGAWLDRTLIGSSHLYSQTRVWDPEGLLSTLPAFGTGILGMLVGFMLKSHKDKTEKTVWLFVAGAAAIFLGLFWDLVFPINKKIWTSSYVLYTGGLAMMVLAICFWFLDVRGIKMPRLTHFMVAFGVNPITAYVASGLLAKTLLIIRVGEDQTLWNRIYETIFASWLGPYNASLLFAITFVLVIWVPIWYLYKKQVYIKV